MSNYRHESLLNGCCHWLTTVVALCLGLIFIPTVSSGAVVTPKKPAAVKSKILPQLKRLQAAKIITDRQYKSWRWQYFAVRKQIKAMPKGQSLNELKGVLATSEAIASQRALDATIAPTVFKTLQVNRSWWSKSAAPAIGTRVTVNGSSLVWQYYSGQGIQIQWLGTFGRANALASTPTASNNKKLALILDEAIKYASVRGSGLSWHYLFDFSKGRAPWASGMAQLTGMQALLRGANVLKKDSYRQAISSFLPLLETPQPSGVNLSADSGTNILLYTWSTSPVLNAQTQSVSALRELSLALGDQRLTALYLASERQLRADLPSYDTGNWSLYSIDGQPADVGYHKLSRDFLRTLCRALTQDQATATAAPVAGAPQPIDPAIYCQAADRFTTYLTNSPSGPPATKRAVPDTQVQVKQQLLFSRYRSPAARLKFALIITPKAHSRQTDDNQSACSR